VFFANSYILILTFFDTKATLYAKWARNDISLATPTRAGYIFKGWFTATSGGTQITSATSITANQTIYAQWIVPQITFSYSTTAITNKDVDVTITTTGGKLEYSKDGTNWSTYTGPVKMTANGPIYARVKDAAGTVVKTAEGKVSNIDKTAPLASIYEDYQTSTGKARISVDVADYETEIDYVELPDGTKKYIEDEKKDNIKIVVIEDKRTNESVNGWQINVAEALKDFTNVTFKTDITQSELVNSDYDIVISNMGVWTSEKTAMLEAAFKAGKDVITIGNDASNAYYVIDTCTAFSATPDNTKNKKVASNEITEKINFNASAYDTINLINQPIEGFEDWSRYETGGQEYTSTGMYEENGARWFHSSAPEVNLQSVFPYLVRKLTRVTTATYEIPKSGTYTFKVYDKAGNCTTKTITTGNYKITYDFNENTIQNGDFQSGLSNWVKSNNDITATADTGIKYKNKQTMRLTTTANGTWNAITNGTIASKYSSNTLYKLSATAYKDDTSTYGAYKNNYNIYIPHYNGETRQDLGLGYLTLNKNKSWTKFETEFTTNGTKWIGIYAAYSRPNGGSTVAASNLWLADVRLERIQNATIGYGNTLGTLPTPTRYGYIFNGWYTEPTGGKQIKSTDKILPQNTTYYAHWTQANYVVNTSPFKNTMTLAEAVTAANNGSTITVLKDCTDTSTVNINKNITLNTNGHTITRSAQIAASANLTFTGSGGIASTDNAVVNNGTGTIIVNGSQIKTTGNGKNAIVNKSTGKIELRSGKIVSELWRGISNDANGSVNVTGGTIQTQWEGIYNPAKGTVTISNVTINSFGSCIFNLGGGTVTVTGGTLTSTGHQGIHNETGTLTVGNASSAISTSSPNLTGKQRGVWHWSGTFNFYNGILKGETEAYGQSITNRRSGATLTTGTSGSYKTAYYR